MSDPRLLDIEATPFTDWITSANVATKVIGGAGLVITPTLVRAEYWPHGKLCWIDLEVDFTITTDGGQLLVTPPINAKTTGSMIPGRHFTPGGTGSHLAFGFFGGSVSLIDVKRYNGSAFNVSGAGLPIAGHKLVLSGWYRTI